MSAYKEKIQRQLRKTLENFRNSQNRYRKTALIHKQSKPKRQFRQRPGFYQEARPVNCGLHSHVLNFFNILTVNEWTLRDRENPESYVQTNFYCKSIRKIEVKDNYIVLYLNDLECPCQTVQETLRRFASDSNEAVREVGSKLMQLSQKLQLNAVNSDSSICLTSEAYEMLDTLGQVPFICKIFSEKLVISKSLLEMKGFSIEQFIVQSLKCKFPVLELLNSKNYQSLLRKEIQFYQGLMDVLYGGIPFASFLNFAKHKFVDEVTSKSNVDYLCEISLSMPIPLVELIKIDKIIQTNQNLQVIHQELQNQMFLPFLSNIRKKEYGVLKNLVPLQQNYLPQKFSRVASYVQKREKLEDDQQKSVKSQFEKSSLTLPFN